MSRSKNKPKANQKTVIEIWGYGVDVEFALIPEERGRELESYEEDEEQESEDDYKSFPEQLWEIFDSQMNGFGGATEVSLFVNDKEIESFTVDEEQAKKTWKEKHDVVGDGVQWIVGEITGSKGCWGKVEIDGDFDRSKLSFEIRTITLYADDYSCLDVFYDGVELEFIGTDTNYDDYFFLKPKKQSRRNNDQSRTTSSVQSCNS
jgi:hypothetical protein